MVSKNWSEPVVARIDDGTFHTIHNVKQAEHFLLRRWKLLRPEALTAAVMACLLYAGDDFSSDKARDAFTDALTSSGIYAELN